MRKERIDLRSFFVPFPRFHSLLNSSLDDIDIRYNAVSGKPEWRERGADAYVPFSSDIMFVVSSRGYNAAYFGNENEYDFSFGAAIWQKTTDYGYTSQNTGYTLVSAKNGWWRLLLDGNDTGWVYKNAGESFIPGIYSANTIYQLYSPTDPTQ